jgi:hypothetical protein
MPPRRLIGACPAGARRAVLMLVPTALVAVFLAGCGDSGIPNAAASPARSMSENSRTVCAAVDKAISDGAAAFGNDLGNLVGYLANSDTAKAEQARTDALLQLTVLVGNVKTASQPAVDPALVTATGQVAQNVGALASDRQLLMNIRTSNDLTPILNRLTRAADPLIGVCN